MSFKVFTSAIKFCLDYMGTEDEPNQTLDTSFPSQYPGLVYYLGYPKFLKLPNKILVRLFIQSVILDLDDRVNKNHNRNSYRNSCKCDEKSLNDEGNFFWLTFLERCLKKHSRESFTASQHPKLVGAFWFGQADAKRPGGITTLYLHRMAEP